MEPVVEDSLGRCQTAELASLLSIDELLLRVVAVSDKSRRVWLSTFTIQDAASPSVGNGIVSGSLLKPDFGLDKGGRDSQSISPGPKSQRF